MTEETWAEQVADRINKTGMTMRQVAEAIELPYRTLQDWKNGKRTPDKLSQWAFIHRTEGLLPITYRIEIQSAWANPKTSGEQVIGFASVEEAEAYLAANYDVVETVKPGNKFKKIPGTVAMIYRGHGPAAPGGELVKGVSINKK